MKRLPEKEENLQLDPSVQRIWEDVVYSMDQYTNDSSLAKFYLPEELSMYVRTTAMVFSQLLYSPIPSREEIKKSRAYGLFYLAISCGVQIYLKERLTIHGFSPYKIVLDDEIARNTRNKIGRLLSEGIKVQSPVSEVMELFIEELTRDIFMRRMVLKGREFNNEKFDNLLPAAIMWGYLLTKELILEDND